MKEIPTHFAVRTKNLTHRYGHLIGLQDFSVSISPGSFVGFIGPDGVGKSTLLALIAGAKRIQSGAVEVLGGNLAEKRDRVMRQPQIAYMPQGLGRNLYKTLTVLENLEFFSLLFNASSAIERSARIQALLEDMGLAPFADRPVGKLSGGMKQKLGLCCALIHDPDLLILDEPTTGVDPLSRRQFWDVIQDIRRHRPTMTVLVATAYMEEAEGFDRLVAMHGGAALFDGTPTELKSREQSASLEEAFIKLLPEEIRRTHKKLVIPTLTESDAAPVIVTQNLTRRFGNFVAVDRVSIEIKKGEIFGFLGSNGCGKTTTMKILTGLLPATEGEALIFGKRPDAQDIEARTQAGYMSQSFSLYEELTVRKNLELHAALFQLPKELVEPRIATLLNTFNLQPFENALPGKLPLGLRQRLSLAVAIIHSPRLLILDEPTSGVDPVARDAFWEVLVDLSRRTDVTIFISTHFMNEGERCDRIALMHAGKILVTGKPHDLVENSRAKNLDEAFVHYITETIKRSGEIQRPATIPMAQEIVERDVATQRSASVWDKVRRTIAYARAEAKEVSRDPVRMSFAFLGTILMMLVLAHGVRSDVENLTYAVLDRDDTAESRAYLNELRGSRYFLERPALRNPREIEERLKNGDISLAIEIPPTFGRDLVKNNRPEIGAWLDGSMPFRAETIRGYLEGLHRQYLNNLASKGAGAGVPFVVQMRFRYNQGFKSVIAIAPGAIAMLLVFIPSILTALGVVREKEMGSIANLYVTPVKRSEFLAGKGLPYVLISMINYVVLVLMAVFLFGVPLKGSLVAMTLGALIYVATTCGMGLLISAFARTQIAALFATAVLTLLPALQFCGILQPVSTLQGAGKFIGSIYPTTYFLRITTGAFPKAIGFMDLLPNILVLIPSFAIIFGLSIILLREQEE